MPPRASIVIPVLDEAPAIVDALERLAPLRAQGAQVIVVDGGSRDGTAALCAGRADLVLQAPRGRASQQNAGARAATAPWLLFLHADTCLPPGALECIASSPRAWGRFDVAIAGRSMLFPLIAALMNLRSRLTGIATGDQAIFVRRDAFDAAGGFPDQALMEDIELSRRLRRRGRPDCVGARVLTSGRRWERHGVARTILLMWRLRLLYWLGVSPQRLARSYRSSPR
jgi:rSAM/selenodomain-associated transferase 2